MNKTLKEIVLGAALIGSAVAITPNVVYSQQPQRQYCGVVQTPTLWNRIKNVFTNQEVDTMVTRSGRQYQPCPQPAPTPAHPAHQPTHVTKHKPTHRPTHPTRPHAVQPVTPPQPPPTPYYPRYEPRVQNPIPVQPKPRVQTPTQPRYIPDNYRVRELRPTLSLAAGRQFLSSTSDNGYDSYGLQPSRHFKEQSNWNSRTPDWYANARLILPGDNSVLRMTLDYSDISSMLRGVNTNNLDSLWRRQLVLSVEGIHHMTGKLYVLGRLEGILDQTNEHAIQNEGEAPFSARTVNYTGRIAVGPAFSLAQDPRHTMQSWVWATGVFETGSQRILGRLEKAFGVQLGGRTDGSLNPRSKHSIDAKVTFEDLGNADFERYTIAADGRIRVLGPFSINAGLNFVKLEYCRNNITQTFSNFSPYFGVSARIPLTR